MSTQGLPELLGKFQIPGRVALVNGNGGLAKINVTAQHSTAEIYLHGAHLTGFQKTGEPPLLFLSRNSHFTAKEPIRGGVPICCPWFGPREGEPAHGFARIQSWELARTSVAADGAVVIRLQLPGHHHKPEWSALRLEFVIGIADQLTMELVATNTSADRRLAIENCLHAYFYVGDLGAVSITGLSGVPFDEFAADAGGVRQTEVGPALRITRETNRVYPDHAGTVEIRDESLGRIIRVEKSNSQSTVLWNPWTTQKLPDDFDPAEYQNMICVESGNVKQNKISLAPGSTAALKAIVSSRPL